MTNNTITAYEIKIAELEKEIATKRNSIDYFKPTYRVDMHDNGLSEYENDMGMVRYYKTMIEEEKAKLAEAEKENQKIARKAEKEGLTVEEYKARETKRKEEKALKAKAKRYKKELEELNNRKAYLEKWLAENEAV